jgi:DNA polymerase III subunit alpha
LGLPEFSAEIPDWVALRFNTTEDFDEEGQFLIFGMVKNIKRGKGWARVEIVDKVGTIGIFDREDTTIEPGSVYVFAIAKNSIISYSTPAEIVEKRNPVGKFLMSAKEMCGPDERFILGVRSRKTKAGANMATVLFCDDVGDLESALVFDYNYDDVIRKAKVGTKVSPVFSRTKDGALTIKEIRRGI